MIRGEVFLRKSLASPMIGPNLGPNGPLGRCCCQWTESIGEKSPTGSRRLLWSLWGAFQGLLAMSAAASCSSLLLALCVCSEAFVWLLKENSQYLLHLLLTHLFLITEQVARLGLLQCSFGAILLFHKCWIADNIVRRWSLLLWRPPRAPLWNHIECNGPVFGEDPRDFLVCLELLLDEFNDLRHVWLCWQYGLAEAFFALDRRPRAPTVTHGLTSSHEFFRCGPLVCLAPMFIPVSLIITEPATSAALLAERRPMWKISSLLGEHLLLCFLLFKPLTFWDRRFRMFSLSFI